MYDLVKSSLYSVMNYAGVFGLTRRAHKDETVILTYHGVLKNGSNSYVNRNCLSADMFEMQMRWLNRNYRVLPLREVIDGLAGTRELPPYAAAITFDGGFRNNYTAAFPVLLKHNLPATIFLPTQYIGQRKKRLWTEYVDSLIHSSTIRRLSIQMNGNLTTFDVSNPALREQASDNIRHYLRTLNPSERERKIIALDRQVRTIRDSIDEVDERYTFLSWDEVRTMADGGVEFGSHSVSDAILATLSPDELEVELTASKKLIEEKLRKPCDLFSYPGGLGNDFSKRDQLALANYGYRAGLTQLCGFNRPGENLFALKRINISRSNNFAYFLAKITGVQTKIRELV